MRYVHGISFQFLKSSASPFEQPLKFEGFLEDAILYTGRCIEKLNNLSQHKLLTEKK